MPETATVLIVLGRFLLGAFFFIAGVRNLMKIELHTGLLAGFGVPQPRSVLLAGLAVQTLGGAMVALGIWPVAGAVGLIVFIVAATVLYHGFWAYSGAERTQHLNATLTNCALVGAFLLVMAVSL